MLLVISLPGAVMRDSWYEYKLKSGKTIGTNDPEAFKGTIFEEGIVERTQYKKCLKTQIKRSTV